MSDLLPTSDTCAGDILSVGMDRMPDGNAIARVQLVEGGVEVLLFYAAQPRPELSQAERAREFCNSWRHRGYGITLDACMTGRATDPLRSSLFHAWCPPLIASSIDLKATTYINCR